MTRRLLCLLAAIVFVWGGTLSLNQARADDDFSFTFMPTRVHEGVTYEARAASSVTTVLLIGYDHKNDGELITSQEGFIYGGQSDFLMLLVIDHENKQVRQLQIDRDTMTPVRFFSKQGNDYGKRRMQICLSHAYGDTQEKNNRNALWAVENLLGIAEGDDGAQIDWYISMDITGIDRLNDLLGGVTVPIEDDFSYYDPTMIQGTTMTLNGAQAQIYCRQRYYIGPQSNESRMVRQGIYMNAASVKLRQMLVDDAGFAKDLLSGMGLIFDSTYEMDVDFGFTTTDHAGTPVTDTPTHYLMTNQSLDAVASLILRALSYEMTEVEMLPGEHRIGISGYMEFIPEQNAGLEWALDALYRPMK